MKRSRKLKQTGSFARPLLGWSLRSHPAELQVILLRNAKRIGHPVEEGKHRGDVHRLRDLVLVPARVAQPLNVFRSCAIGRLGDKLHIVEQSPFGRGQAGGIKVSVENRANTSVIGSLNTQEVGVAVQSIRAMVQEGDVAGDHLLVPASEVALGKVNGIRKLHHLPQKVRPGSEALDDARDLFPPRTRSPEIVGSRHLAGGVAVFSDADLRCGRRWLRYRRRPQRRKIPGCFAHALILPSDSCCQSDPSSTPPACRSCRSQWRAIRRG